jgi:biopolymer transport protein ExbD
MKTSASDHGRLAELNITPLLDLVFVLLVIFIITTPQMMNNLEIALPCGKPPPPKLVKPLIERIVVPAQGDILLNGKPIQITLLADALRSIKSEHPDPNVVVQADDQADYQRMVSVLDILRQLDISKVGLATASPDVNPAAGP